MSNKYDYDVIIIGAGISGLICGCYLAKAGLKTLIIEKNSRPGGYCTSFQRGEFHFDACVHALCSLRNEGVLFKILNSLGIQNRLKFIRDNPTDRIITEIKNLNIYNNLDQTIEEFAKAFPKERVNILNFFQFVANGNFLKVRSKTFSDILDNYFYNKKLKSIWLIIMVQLLGIDPLKLSAVVSCLLIREFMLDGGYYPSGGMQKLPDLLEERFKELNGRIYLNRSVENICILKQRCKEVRLNTGESISSKYFVAACDLHQVLNKMINLDSLRLGSYLNKISKLEYSQSGFLLYLGLKSLDLEYPYATHYILTELNLPKVKENINNLNFDHGVLKCSIINQELKVKNQSNNVSLFLGTNALYQKEAFWRKRRKALEDSLIKLSEVIVPDIREFIVLKLSATPLTFEKWTGNYNGAGYGWASTPDQFGNPLVSQNTPLDNLYISGHWSNQSSGVSFVANCAVNTAKLIMAKERIINRK